MFEPVSSVLPETPTDHHSLVVIAVSKTKPTALLALVVIVVPETETGSSRVVTSVKPTKAEHLVMSVRLIRHSKANPPLFTCTGTAKQT